MGQVEFSLVHAVRPCRKGHQPQTVSHHHDGHPAVVYLLDGALAGAGTANYHHEIARPYFQANFLPLEFDRKVGRFLSLVYNVTIENVS